MWQMQFIRKLFGKEICDKRPTYMPTFGEYMQIQHYPVADSPNNDAFEAVVETYFQTEGYITSAGKWFWIRDDDKQQRGYQDIDVLAVSGEKLVIVSVSSNLDDKVNSRSGVEKLEQHFERVQLYLANVPAYKWLVCGDKKRKIQKVVAYNRPFGGPSEIIKKSLSEANICELSAETMLESLQEHVAQRNLKIQNQLLRTIQLLGKNKFLKNSLLISNQNACEDGSEQL
jgi:hypothetical protein